MKKTQGVSVLLTVVLSYTILIMAGCSGGGDGGTVTYPQDVQNVTALEVEAMDFVDSETFLAGIQAEMEDDGAHLNTVSTCLGGYGTMAAAPQSVDPAEGEESAIDIINIIKMVYRAFAWKIKYGYAASKVTFAWSTDGKVESGLLVEPRALIHTQKYPMLVFMHPTQTLRKFSPSQNNDSDDEGTTQLAKYVLATMGYIVVVPDYPGLGDNTDVHPYCLSTLSRSAVGMIQAVKTLGTRWDGRIFLMGYSEGGYATVVTAKDILQNHKELDLKAAAALDGPYSLSETMYKLILNASDQYATPYFLPYVIAGYGNAYPDVYDLQFDHAVLEDVRDLLGKMMNGDFDGGAISDVMRGVDPYNGPASILTQSTLAALRQTDTEAENYIKGKFEENDAYYNWSPTIPMLFCHNPNDDSVPVGNTLEAAAAWDGNPNVTVHYFTEYIDGLGTVHAGALPYAYLLAIAWINDQAGK